jgi:hypothetical protein
MSAFDPKRTFNHLCSTLLKRATPVGNLRDARQSLHAGGGGVLTGTEVPQGLTAQRHIFEATRKLPPFDFVGQART